MDDSLENHPKTRFRRPRAGGILATLSSLTAALSLGAACAGCGDADAQFDVQYAKGYVNGTSTVSVFGVFKDGRMSSESWDALGPRLSSPLGSKTTCPVEYSEGLATAKPDLASALDDYARSLGINDDLLESFAPAAQGDAILVITMAGRPPQKIGGDGPGTTPTMSQPSQMGNSRRGGLGGTGGGAGGHGQMPPSSGSTTDGNMFEVSAFLYSKRQRQSVAVVDMKYSGPSTEDALTKFAEKLRTAIPGLACTGWSSTVQLDDKHIRQLIEQR